MDELELLKKDWQKQGKNLPKLSYNEIYEMTLKKSSSIVKWIFIISVLEFVLMASLEVIGRYKGTYEAYEKMGFGKGFMFFSSCIAFAILFYFILQFYKNYRNIITTDSTKVLMENILKTRRTVKRYVFINLSFMAIMMLFIFAYLLFYNSDFLITENPELKEIPTYVLGIFLFFTTVFCVGVLGVTYYLIYGLLTGKLNKNYKELKRLEL